VIGVPLPDLQIYLLDGQQQPVPIGVPGEIYVGGSGLARGYLHRPELTRERFIPNPFSPAPGARLYRSGDQGRYLADGRLEYLGRVDEQVKIRGYRIEPGEIEEALRQHPLVRECLVVAGENASNERRLVAYIVANGEVQELRHWLQTRLPDYMIPSAFVFLEALPLTAHGKVDRRALPAPDRARAEPATRFVAPRTPVEETLAGIWAEVLGLERVGVHDDFFELGGHSLMATQVLSRLHRHLPAKLPLRRLFETPTVAGLAEAVTATMAATAEQEELFHLLDELERPSEADSQV
jgi:hypothetical protein